MSAIEQSVPIRYPDVLNYIGGKFVTIPGVDHLDITNPADGA